jgi:hypothetical protein
VAYVLVVAAFQFGDPIAFFVLMIADDALLQGAVPSLLASGTSSQQRSLRTKPSLA